MNVGFYNTFSLARDRISDLLFQLTFPKRNPAINLEDDFSYSLAISLRLGIEFIRKSQHGDGSFRDFFLAPGISTAWITAHAAYVMQGIPGLGDTAAKSAHYLYKIGCRDGSWSYNRLVSEDNDSTAQALSVLHYHHYMVPAAWIEQVIGSQSACGGFPTYRAYYQQEFLNDGWREPHADVTIMVIDMLKRYNCFSAERMHAEKWLASVCSEGIIPSYWWSVASYGLWAQVRTGFQSFSASTKSRELLSRECTVPSLPMLIYSAGKFDISDHITKQALLYLLALQRSDGSWDCGPCLRVTKSNVFQHSLQAPGRVYTGRRRLFSTLHAVSALSQFR